MLPPTPEVAPPLRTVTAPELRSCDTSLDHNAPLTPFAPLSIDRTLNEPLDVAELPDEIETEPPTSSPLFPHSQRFVHRHPFCTTSNDYTDASSSTTCRFTSTKATGSAASNIEEPDFHCHRTAHTTISVCDTSVNAPLEVELVPLEIDTDPPTFPLDPPAFITTPPPSPTAPSPIVILILPDAPETACPVRMATEPLDPLDDEPVFNEREPLVPDVPASAE